MLISGFAQSYAIRPDGCDSSNDPNTVPIQNSIIKALRVPATGIEILGSRLVVSLRGSLMVFSNNR